MGTVMSYTHNYPNFQLFRLTGQLCQPGATSSCPNKVIAGSQSPAPLQAHGLAQPQGGVWCPGAIPMVGGEGQGGLQALP